VLLGSQGGARPANLPLRTGFVVQYGPVLLVILGIGLTALWIVGLDWIFLVLSSTFG
jgi:hypothetical protein